MAPNLTVAVAMLVLVRVRGEWSGGDASVAVVEGNGRLIVYAELFIARGG